MNPDAVKGHVRPITEDELREVAARHRQPVEDAVSLEDVGIYEAAERVLYQKVVRRMADKFKAVEVDIDNL